MRRTILLASGLIGFILFGIFVLRPAFIGYVTYQGMQEANASVEEYGQSIRELKDELLVSATNLSVSAAFSRELFSQLERASGELVSCNAQLSRLSSEYTLQEEQCAGLRESLQDELVAEQERAAEYLRNYEMLAANIATNLCCKAKLDNSRIGFYEIREHKVVCSEDGGTPLACSFG